MHLLGKGRLALLEFLRNLTPMVLMGAISLVMWARLDFRRWDWSNWSSTVIFYLCLFTALLSLAANISNFLDHAFSPLGFDRALSRLKRRKHSGKKLLMAMALLTWRRKPIVIVEAFVAIAVVYGGVFGGLLSAVNAAVAAIRNGAK
jgi:hypothetical protein